MIYCFAGASLMTLMGFAMIFGLMLVEKKMQGHDWSKKYNRLIGLGFVLMFVPWLFLTQTEAIKNAEFWTAALDLIASSVPGFLYLIIIEGVYKKKLKAEQK